MDNFNIGPDYRLNINSEEQFYSGLINWCFKIAQIYCKGKGIDVGGNNETLSFPGADIIDKKNIKKGIKHDAYNTGKDDDSLDYVFSSHCLEHLQNPEKAIREFYRVLKPGGILFLYLPFPNDKLYDPNLNLEVRKQHRWQPWPYDVARLLLMECFQILYIEGQRDQASSFIVVGRK